MKFLTIGIVNFLAIGEASFHLADRGLVLIQGTNEDDSSAASNGSGKSSIADAICWCLYGVTARGVSGDAVVNNAVGKDCMVTLLVEDAGERYQITRHRRSKAKKNALELVHCTATGPVDLTLGTEKLTQERIERLIGASYDIFKAAVYAGQESFPDLPGMTDKTLKLLVEEASGVTVLEAAYAEARGRLSAVRESVEDADHGCRMLESGIIAYRDTARDLKARADAWVAEHAGVIARRRGEVEEAERHLDLYLREAAGLRTHAEILADLKTVEDKIAAAYASTSRRADLDRSVAVAEASIRGLEVELRLARDDRDRLEAELKDVDHQLGCPCPACSRPLSEADLTPARQIIIDRLAKQDARLLKIAFDLDTARGALQNVTKTRDAFVATVIDITDAVAQRASLNEEREDLARMTRTIETLRERAEEMRRRLDTESARTNPHVEPLKTALTKLRHGRDQLAERRAHLAELQDQAVLAEAVVKVFSPAGVRAHILDEVTPFLNAQTAKYLTTLSDGRITAVWTTLVANAKGELKEKFSIEVEKEKAAASFAGLSGGEKRKVRIACALALQDLVARRAAKPIAFMIADEIDDALDESGLERLTTVLNDKAAEHGSVFVISHRSALRDAISQVMTVTMKDGRAQVAETVS